MNTINKTLLIVIIVLAPIAAYSQEKLLSVFDPLIDKTWKAAGSWGDGSAFKQETLFTANLNNTLIIANSKGYTNTEQTTYGNRNHGIRWFDKAAGKIKFVEYDAFGGRTTGEVMADGKNIIYTYNYGESVVTDMWEYVNDSTYNFKVGSYKDGKWEQLYLETQFKEIKEQISVAHFGKKLVGSWATKAWDGRLEEQWKLDNNQLFQSAKYTENDEVQYQATSKIEKVGDEYVIFSVIKDSDPKIFKATSVEKDRIVFENSEYEYPNKVVYQFNEDGTYNRTISGTQNNEPSSYTFKFKQQ